MEAWRAIRMRRAIREFDGRSLEPAQLDRILDAGRRAPSSKNEQRWAFVSVTNRDRLEALSKVGDYAGHVTGAAAAVAIVVPEAGEDWRRESIAMDSGQAAENMMIAAWEMGIGSVHAAVYDEKAACDLLGYPKGWRCDYLLSLGFPADPKVLDRPPKRGGRRPFDDVVHRETW
ncbi:MAG: nitroreductase family protein [Actinomycetota bacterium]